MRSAVRALYKGFQSKFLLPGSQQVVIRPTRGVRQGFPLSPALFVLFAEPWGALMDAPSCGFPPPGFAHFGLSVRGRHGGILPSTSTVACTYVGVLRGFWCQAEHAEKTNSPYECPSSPSCPYCVISGTDTAKSLGAIYNEDIREQLDFDIIIAKMRTRRRLCSALLFSV